MTERVIISGMYQDDGWWVPEGQKFGTYYRRHAEALRFVLPWCMKTRVVVQAGGHMGAYPKWLAEHFETVYTFEIEQAKFKCLVLNCNNPRIYAMRGALYHREGTIRSGHRRVSDEEGTCPTFLIDNMNLSACDLIALDVDGSELYALLGARMTISRCKPIILLEDGTRNKGDDQVHYQRCVGFMMDMDYEIVGNCGPDNIWKMK